MAVLTGDTPLADILRQRGITLDQLSRASGVDPVTCRYLARGPEVYAHHPDLTRGYTPRTLALIAAALRVDPSFLVGDHGEDRAGREQDADLHDDDAAGRRLRTRLH